MEKSKLITDLKKIVGDERVITEESASLDASKDYIVRFIITREHIDG